MGMGGGLQQQVGLRAGVPRPALPAPPPAAAPAGISFQSAGTLDKPVSTAAQQPGALWSARAPVLLITSAGGVIGAPATCIPQSGVGTDMDPDLAEPCKGAFEIPTATSPEDRGSGASALRSARLNLVPCPAPRPILPTA